MSPTIPQILQFDSAGLERAADAFDRLAGKLDERCDTLVTELRGVEDAWTAGDGRDAAVARGTSLRQELALTNPPVLGIAQVLDDHAAAVRALASHLGQVVQEARAQRMDVADDGTITPPPAHHHTEYLELVRQRDKFASQIGELLRAAAELDADTARRLAAYQPPDAAGTAGSRGAYPRGKVPGKGTDPQAVEDWWNGLTADERRYVTAMYPDLVGNLDGVPIAARDQANRLNLDSETDRLGARQKELTEREQYIRSMADQGRLGEVYPDSPNPVGAAYAELDRIDDERKTNGDRLGGLKDISDRANRDTGQRAYVIGLSTEGNGRAIVSVGNPDTAQHVATYVPGTGSSLDGAISGDLTRIDRMAGDAGKLAPGEETAVVMWVGYDAPQSIPDAGKERFAEDAGPDLRRFQDGLRVTHDGPAAHHTVLGHSYGTTVVGYAARDGSLNTDEIVLVASPGAGVGHANDLHLTGHDSADGRVFATTADKDPIQAARNPWVLASGAIPVAGPVYAVWEGIDGEHMAHGRNPTHDDFGAREFSSAPGTSVGKAHSEYWDNRNPARDNFAKIIVGHGGEVT